jgi:hypothetical protein
MVIHRIYRCVSPKENKRKVVVMVRQQLRMSVCCVGGSVCVFVGVGCVLVMTTWSKVFIVSINT